MKTKSRLILILFLLGVVPHVLSGLLTHHLVSGAIVGGVVDGARLMEKLNRLFFFSIFAGTCGFAVLGLTLYRYVSGPLRRVLLALKTTVDLEGVSPDGRVGGRDELFLLESTMLALVERLRHREGELSETNLKLEEKNKLLSAQGETLTAHNDLLYLILQASSRQELAKGFLSKFTEYDYADRGGVYLYDEEGARASLLSAAGGEAGSEVSDGVMRLKPAFEASMKSIRLRPKDDLAQSFSSLLAGGEKSELLCTPIFGADLKIRGVMLLSGEGFPDSGVEFANFASFVFGMGLEKIEVKRKLKQMAEDLRIKGEMLSHRNRELMEIDRLRSEFISLVSHELRTPLNSIIGFSEILLDSIAGELQPRQKECVRDILGSGLHLLQIVNDILDLSKMEAGYLELECREFGLEEELAVAVRTMTPMASKRNQEIRVRVEDGIDTVVSDSGKFSQIILNLISNALKFSPDGAPVEVRVSSRGEMIEVSIRDHGIGISAQDREKLFKPFVQADSSHARNYEGTGLGLVICKKLVEALGGRIWVDSTPGQGSTFSFTVAVMKGAAEEGRRRKEGSAFFTKMEEELNAGRLGSAVSSKLILVYENGRYEKSELCSKLEAEGCEVISFADENDLMRAAAMLQPDVVTLNFVGPGYDGKGLLNRLNGEPKTAEIPLLIVTDSEDYTEGALLPGRMARIMKLGDVSIRNIRFMSNEIQ